ncbi:hypothetical protein [Aeromicrobium sp. Root236]|uniref:hypothetical protein n=1 Tax=Aeromicrobium sp. Root236 TaxID=1736498 RepID=UPI000AB64469|nr:hypothetical protein [Aeromicrobium sp. Root236]
MTPDVWTDAALARLQAAGYKAIEVDQSVLPGARAMRRSNLRLRWFFTRLHTFVVFVTVDHVTGPDLSAIADLAAEWAKRVKGGLPIGLQTGVAMIPVIVTSSVDDAAQAAALAKPRKRFATMAFPMIVDPVRLFVATYSRTVAWGAAYMDFLADQQRIIVGTDDAPVLATQGSRAFVRLYNLLLPVLGLGALAGVVTYFSG